MGKYLNNRAVLCGQCKEPLIAKGVAENTRHFYSLGQLYECRCGASKIWTNSIRDPEKLLSFLTGKEDSYRQGFCNDLFCGFCFGDVIPNFNGAFLGNDYRKAYDRMGCCKGEKWSDHNQALYADFGAFSPEREASDLEMAQWYKAHFSEWASKLEHEVGSVVRTNMSRTRLAHQIVDNLLARKPVAECDPGGKTPPQGGTPQKSFFRRGGKSGSASAEAEGSASAEAEGSKAQE